MLTLAAVAVACSGDDDSSNTTGDTGTGEDQAVDREATLTIATITPPGTWDPVTNPAPVASVPFNTMVYDQIVELGPDLEPKPALAESWEQAEDGTSVTFTIRDDVTFWDGSPLDAEAIVANLERGRDDPASAVAPLLSNVASVEAPDATTVVVTFNEPDFIFPLRLATEDRMSSIVNPAAFDDPSLETDPAGSGPYQLVSASPTEVVYERVEDHWDETSGLAARVVNLVIPDATARLNAFRTGEVQVSSVIVDQVPEYEALGDGFELVRFEDTTSVATMFLNYTRPPLDDPLVRRAISLAVDREEIASMSNGETRPTQQIFSGITEGWVEDLDSPERLARDTDQASELLEEAGYADGFDLSVTFPATPSAQSLAQVLQQQLADVGINVDAAPESPQSFTAAYAEGNYDAVISIEAGNFDPALSLEANLNPPRGWGYPDYLADAIAEAGALPAGEDRTAAYEAISETLVEQPLHVPLRNDTLSLGVSSDVVGTENLAWARTASALVDPRHLGLSASG